VHNGKNQLHWCPIITTLPVHFSAGNDNLNLLTTAKRYKLRIDLADFNNNTAYAEYDNFVVNSAADKYRLASLGTYLGTAGKTS
jgi:ficolin